MAGRFLATCIWLHLLLLADPRLRRPTAAGHHVTDWTYDKTSRTLTVHLPKQSTTTGTTVTGTTVTIA